MKTTRKLQKSFLLILISIINAMAQAPSIQWQKVFGGTLVDRAYALETTPDGGYILAGESLSSNGNVTGNHGGFDFWVVKLNSFGDIQWQKSLGGSGSDSAYDIEVTNDGNYIVAGYTGSSNGDVTLNQGFYDMWVVKLNANGDLQWQKSLGGSGYEVANSIKQTSDGGYIVAGSTTSTTSGDVVGGNGGYQDYWIVKLDSNGNLQWQKTYGGLNGSDTATSIQVTPDGGFIVAGTATATDGDVVGNHSISADYWILKLTSSGNIEWKKCFGGTGPDSAYSIQTTEDGGYIVAGEANSANGDVTGNLQSGYWIVKLDINGIIQWQKGYGGSSLDTARSIQSTADGGYVAVGYTTSNDGDVVGNHGLHDLWLIRLDSDGNLQWQKTIGGSLYDYGYDVKCTADGGYIMTGLQSSSSSSDNYWIVKLNSDALSVDGFEYNNITLFPNPTNDKLTVKLDFHEPSQEISIYDVSGKIVYKQKCEGLSTVISTTDWQEGIYILTLISDNGRTYQKFIVN